MPNLSFEYLNKVFPKFTVIFLILFMVIANQLYSKTFYIDSVAGNDSNTGTSSLLPLKSFSKVPTLVLIPGDSLLLKNGSVFTQQLAINQISGTPADNIVIAAYGEGNQPLISPASGLAILIKNSNYITIKDFELTKNAVDVSPVQSDPIRYTEGIVLDNLYIHDVPSHGISLNYLYKGTYNSKIRNCIVRNCRIEGTNQNGMVVDDGINISIIDNNMDMIGQNGYRITQCTNTTLRGNTVNRPGRTKDRGDGGYVLGCNGILVERNVFMNSRGQLDGCGFHIDVNNKNVVVQHNLSMNNEGGFLEILGDNYNCSFRYNISINDGSRVKGVINDHGDTNTNDGHILFITGNKASGTFNGPINTYVYNNTIYTKSDLTATFDLRYTINGLFIANNIFHLTGPTKNVLGAKKNEEPAVVLPQNVIFKHNIYLNSSTLPSGMLIDDTEKIIGDVGFANPGGLSAADYRPSNSNLVVDKSIAITNIPGDVVGLTVGLKVDKDFFGNPIVGTPDMGAIESTLNTGISDMKAVAKELSAFKIHPNITENSFKVIFNDTTSRKYRILNLAGKIVKTGILCSEKLLSVQDLPDGIYSISIEGYQAAEKFVKF